MILITHKVIKFNFLTVSLVFDERLLGRKLKHKREFIKKVTCGSSGRNRSYSMINQICPLDGKEGTLKLKNNVFNR